MKITTLSMALPFKKYLTNPFLGIFTLLLAIIVTLGVSILMNIISSQFFLQTTNNQVVASNENATTNPTFLRIPSLELSLIINQTEKSNQKGSGVFHLTTPVSKKSQSIIIYGQNTPSIFERLSQLQKGERIFLVTQDGILHTYLVEGKMTMSLSELANSTEDALYLTTQYGFVIQKHLIIKATPLIPPVESSRHRN